MNLRTVSIVFVLLALGLFASLNWVAFNTPTVLSLGVAEVKAPLGLIMLVLAGLLTTLFLLYILLQQAGVILEARRYAKELKAHRELADTAEASRFTELRSFLDTELRRSEAQSAASVREIGARIDKLESSLQTQFAESTRTLSAYVGEMDDKLDRVLAARPS